MHALKRDAAVKAAETGIRLGISANEPVDIFKVLKEIAGLSFVLVQLSENISGFFMRKKKAQYDVGVVVINNAKSRGHQNFTAAHEYYHILYDEGMVMKLCPIKGYSGDTREEQKANDFASYFLIPDDALELKLYKRTSGRKVDISDLIYLENHFAVSHALMLKRLREMGEITQDEADTMRGGIIYNARIRGYSTELYEKRCSDQPVIYSEYAELARKKLEQGKISNGLYESLMIDAGYLDELFGMSGVDTNEVACDT